MSPTDASLPRLPQPKTLLGVVAAFFGLMLLVYGNSLSNEFVRWDDGLLVYDNAAIRQITPASLRHIFTTYDPELYIPLTFLTYQIDYAIAGHNPFLYHLDNFVLHTLNALGVAWLAFLLLRRKWVALGCGLLFALHPLHTEAVEWVSARKDVLSTFFFLLSIIGYVYWQESRSTKTRTWSLIAFTLGLLSKVMIITLPVVLVLIDLLRGRKIGWAMLRDKIPYVVLSVIFGIIGLLGKTGVIQSSSLSGKILMAFKSAFFYITQILWPAAFSLLYPYGKPITLASPDFFIPIIILSAVAVAAWLLRKRAPELLFGLAFYLLTVAPTFLNFAKGGELDIYFASDRYAYIPSIGIFIALTMLLWRLIAEGRGPRNEMILKAAGAVAIVVCMFLSYRQTAVWKNTETLFTNVLRLYPESSHVAHNNLGNVYRLNGDNEKAIQEYEKALAVGVHPKILANLGAAYRKLGRLDDALKVYAQALTINKDNKESHLGLGLVYLAQGKVQQAAEEFAVAGRIDPFYEESFTNLGAARMQLGQVEEAIAAYRQAITINAFFPDAHYNLGVALEGLGRAEEAVREYETTVALVPTFIPARINLGLLYYRLGRPEDSRTQFEAILRIDPQNRAARSALEQMGR